MKKLFSKLTKPSIRVLNPGDLQDIWKIQSSNDDNTSILLDIDKYIQDCDGDDSTAYGLFEGTELVGIIKYSDWDTPEEYVDIKNYESSRFVYRIIDSLTVSPQYRYKNLGSSLIEYIKDVIIMSEKKSIILFADPLTDSVIHFYFKNGFTLSEDGLMFRIFM